jgi:hypothetical protein
MWASLKLHMGQLTNILVVRLRVAIISPPKTWRKRNGVTTMILKFPTPQRPFLSEDVVPNTELERRTTIRETIKIPTKRSSEENAARRRRAHGGNQSPKAGTSAVLGNGRALAP